MIAIPHISGLFRVFLVLTCLGLISACGKSEPVSESKALEQTASAGKKNRTPLKECTEAKAGGPEDVVRALYQQYPFAGRKALVNEPQEVLDK